MRLAELEGKRVAVWGYGREGRAALHLLLRRLPGQRLGLVCSDNEVASARALYGDTLDIHGGEPDFATLWRYDVIVKSPGVSAYKPVVQDARAAGVAFTSGTALWFAENPQARVIAVTGTKGKSTTSSLVAHLLRGLKLRTALAGNIGLPLLELLEPETPPDAWVVELSSFQTGDAANVAVGLVTNVHEEHLDWHGSRERYVADKLALADASRCLVVNGLQEDLLARTAEHANRVLFGVESGWHVADGMIRRAGRDVFAVADLPLPGLHNALNACAALAAIEAFGADAVAAAAHLVGFRALPHRLQVLGERDRLTWINDSIATTPAATIEALHSLDGKRVCVLVGGFDRGVDWTPFARDVQAHPPQAVVTIGANGPRIAELLAQAAPNVVVERAGSLAAAVAAARRLTPPGGVVLLSPGAPSFDQFRDYADRGRAYAQLAGFDPLAIAGIEGLGIA